MCEPVGWNFLFILYDTNTFGVDSNAFPADSVKQRVRCLPKFAYYLYVCSHRTAINVLIETSSNMIAPAGFIGEYSKPFRNVCSNIGSNKVCPFI